MAQHCHGEHEVMMVLVGALGLQPCQAAGPATQKQVGFPAVTSKSPAVLPSYYGWTFFLTPFLKSPVLCFGDHNNGPSMQQEKQSHPVLHVLSTTPPPRPSIKSHEQIFKPLPSVLLLIASVKKYYFPNCIRGREKICIPKDQSSCTRQPGSTAHSLKMISLLCSNGSICLSCLLTG